jgi:NADPH-dependent ferric siderophore reductase
MSSQQGPQPWRFFALQVARTRRVGPSMVRITFTGPEVDGFRSGGRDQRFKLFLPQPHQERPLVPVEAGAEGWFAAWQAMDPDERAVMRSYTVRAQRPGELAVDFALHGGTGPAGRWAAAAQPGDQVVAIGPTEEDNAGIDFRPPPGTDWVMLAADLTALPAVAGILDRLPAGLPVRAWVEVPHPEDAQPLDTDRGDRRVEWLTGRSALDAVREAELPQGTGYAWIAGEAATVRGLRRHLVNERGWDRTSVTFTGYWRRGATEEQLVAEELAGGSRA